MEITGPMRTIEDQAVLSPEYHINIYSYQVSQPVRNPLLCWYISLKLSNTAVKIISSLI